jgi:hypothetical protein
MKLMRWLWIGCLLGLLFITSQVAAQTGGQYDLTWNTIDGGGGQISGGLYTLDGTIGQPDAGQIGGGAYTLGGGFWGGGVTNGVLDKKVYLPVVIK